MELEIRVCIDGHASVILSTVAQELEYSPGEIIEFEKERDNTEGIHGN